MKWPWIRDSGFNFMGSKFGGIEWITWEHWNILNYSLHVPKWFSMWLSSKNSWDWDKPPIPCFYIYTHADVSFGWMSLSYLCIGVTSNLTSQLVNGRDYTIPQWCKYVDDSMISCILMPKLLTLTGTMGDVRTKLPMTC